MGGCDYKAHQFVIKMTGVGLTHIVRTLIFRSNIERLIVLSVSSMIEVASETENQMQSMFLLRELYL